MRGSAGVARGPSGHGRGPEPRQPPHRSGRHSRPCGGSGEARSPAAIAAAWACRSSAASWSPRGLPHAGPGPAGPPPRGCRQARRRATNAPGAAAASATTSRSALKWETEARGRLRQRSAATASPSPSWSPVTPTKATPGCWSPAYEPSTTG